jgi:tRNA modification GTPase
VVFESLSMKDLLIAEWDTIAAVSTPKGQGGIGIIRVSGKRSRVILNRMVLGLPDELEDKKMMLRWVREPQVGKKIDQALICFMKGPNTFTGEDVVEIQGHGGTENLKALLAATIKAGARAAKPGEFTYRAFINGRIDLTQAESISKLIMARTQRAREVALVQLEGSLSQRINDWIKTIKEIRANIEAQVDFCEEEIEVMSSQESERMLQVVEHELDELEQTKTMGRAFGSGVTVALVGRTNVGKSSLFNEFMQKQRSIVDQHPGTTRDYVEGTVEINGVAMTFVDTAGLRENASPMEEKAYQLSEKTIKAADLLLCIADGAEGVSEKDLEIYERYRNKKKIAVLNKIDQMMYQKAPEKGPWGEAVLVSAKMKMGMKGLAKKIVHGIIGGSSWEVGSLIITEQRHLEGINRARKSLQKSLEGLRKKIPLELVSLDLKEAYEFLEGIIGKGVGEDILERIFSKFCIGK